MTDKAFSQDLEDALAVRVAKKSLLLVGALLTPLIGIFGFFGYDFKIEAAKILKQGEDNVSVLERQERELEETLEQAESVLRELEDQSQSLERRASELRDEAGEFLNVGRLLEAQGKIVEGAQRLLAQSDVLKERSKDLEQRSVNTESELRRLQKKTDDEIAAVRAKLRDEIAGEAEALAREVDAILEQTLSSRRYNLSSVHENEIRELKLFLRFGRAKNQVVNRVRIEDYGREQLWPKDRKNASIRVGQTIVFDHRKLGCRMSLEVAHHYGHVVTSDEVGVRVQWWHLDREARSCELLLKDGFRTMGRGDRGVRTVQTSLP